jgi:hypothetical protein
MENNLALAEVFQLPRLLRFLNSPKVAIPLGVAPLPKFHRKSPADRAACSQ